jgi:hypothetical protein
MTTTIETTQKNQKFQNIKNHLKNNKTVYITGAICLVVGAAGTLLYSQKVVASSQEAKNIALVNWKTLTFQQQTTIVELPSRGHRGNVILNDKTGRVYGSQNEAAKNLGVSSSAISRHLHGDWESVNGTTLTNLGENLSEQVRISA